MGTSPSDDRRPDRVRRADHRHHLPGDLHLSDSIMGPYLYGDSFWYTWYPYAFRHAVAAGQDPSYTHLIYALLPHIQLFAASDINGAAGASCSRSCPARRLQRPHATQLHPQRPYHIPAGQRVRAQSLGGLHRRQHVYFLHLSLLAGHQRPEPHLDAVHAACRLARLRLLPPPDAGATPSSWG